MQYILKKGLKKSYKEEHETKFRTFDEARDFMRNDFLAELRTYLGDDCQDMSDDELLDKFVNDETEQFSFCPEFVNDMAWIDMYDSKIVWTITDPNGNRVYF